MDLTTLRAQLLAWLVVCLVCFSLGNFVLGLFFGVGSTVTWLVTLAIMAVASLFVVNEDDEECDETVVSLSGAQ